MRCADIHLMISRAADGEATAGQMRTIESHAAACPGCAREMRELAAYRGMMRGAFGQAAASALPADFDRALARRMTEPLSFWERVRAAAVPRLAVRVAVPAAVVAGVAAALYLGARTGTTAGMTMLKGAVSAAEAAQAEEAIDRRAREILSEFL